MNDEQAEKSFTIKIKSNFKYEIREKPENPENKTIMNENNVTKRSLLNISLKKEHVLSRPSQS